MNKMLL